MSIKYLLCLAACVCLVIAGCGGPEDAIVGKWTGVDVQMPGNPAVAETIKSKVSNVVLNLRPDKHFTLGPESGTWVLKQGKVFLTITTVNGADIAEQKKKMMDLAKGNPTAEQAIWNDSQIGSLSDDDKTLSLTISTGMSGPVLFVFKKSPG